MNRSVLLATLTILTALAAFWSARRPSRQKFASPRAQEVAAQARDLFARGADTYSDFRGAVRDADPVLHADARRLWREGALTPEAVERTLPR